MKADRMARDDRRVLLSGFVAGVLALALTCYYGIVLAAPAVTLAATASSTVAPANVTLTWTAMEVGSCTASGGWTGTKTATGGTEILTNVLASASYTLTCSTLGGTAELTWTLPMQNIDGSPYTDPKGFNVYHAATSGGVAAATPLLVDSPTATTYTVTGLPAGTRYFGIKSLSQAGIESAMTSLVNKVVTTQALSAQSAVTLTPRPKPPTNVVVNVLAYEWLPHPVEGTRLGRNVGIVPLNTSCDEEPVVQSFGGTYYAVPLEAVRLTKTPKSATIVALCAPSIS